MPMAFLSILLYLHSASVKLLIANVMGCRIELLGTMSFLLVSVVMLHQGLHQKHLFLSKAV